MLNESNILNRVTVDSANGCLIHLNKHFYFTLLYSLDLLDLLKRRVRKKNVINVSRSF